MKALIAAAMLCGTAYADENWIITPDVRKACAEQGGCILTLPDGHLIPMKAVQQAMIEAFEAGKSEGKQTCKRREI